MQTAPTSVLASRTAHGGFPKMRNPSIDFTESPRLTSQFRVSQFKHEEGPEIKKKFQPRGVTQQALKRCHIVKTKNQLVMPLQKGDGLARIAHTRQEMRFVRHTQDNFHPRESYSPAVNSGSIRFSNKRRSMGSTFYN